MPEAYAEFDGIARAPREALPRHAGHGVHHRARQAVDAADPQRQAHRPGRGAHRRRHGRGGADHPRGGGAAGHARAGGLLPAPAVRPRQAKAEAKTAGTLLATGLNVSPGAAVGVVAFDADLAETWAKDEKKPVIMVRPETKPDDVHGMLAAKGILTSRGGAHQPRGPGGPPVRQAGRGRGRGAGDRPERPRA